MTNLTAAVRKALKVTSPRSKKSLSKWESVFFVEIFEICFKNREFWAVWIAYMGIRYGYMTGRLTAEADIRLRAMTAYQFVTFLMKVVKTSQGSTEADALTAAKALLAA